MGKYVGGIEGSVDIDIKKAESSIRKLRSELKQLEQNYKTVTNVTSSGDPLKELTTSAEAYKAQLAQVKARVKELKAELKTSTGSNTDKTTEQLKQAEKEAKSLTSALKTLKQVKEALVSTGNIQIVEANFLSQISKANEGIVQLKEGIKGLKTEASAASASAAKPAEAVASSTKKATVDVKELERELMILKNLYGVVAAGDSDTLSNGLEADAAYTAEYTEKLKQARKELASLIALKKELANSKTDSGKVAIAEIDSSIANNRAVVTELRAALAETKNMKKLLSTADSTAGQAEQLQSIQQAIDLRNTEIEAINGTKTAQATAASQQSSATAAQVADVAKVDKAREAAYAEEIKRLNKLERAQMEAEDNYGYDANNSNWRADFEAESRSRLDAIAHQQARVDAVQQGATLPLEAETHAAQAATVAEETLAQAVARRNAALSASIGANEVDPYATQIVPPDMNRFGTTISEITTAKRELAECANKIATLKNSLDSVDGSSLSEITATLTKQEALVQALRVQLAALARVKYGGTGDGGVSRETLVNARDQLRTETERLALLRQSSNVMMQAGQQGAESIRAVIAEEEARLIALQSHLAALRATAAAPGASTTASVAAVTTMSSRFSDIMTSLRSGFSRAYARDLEDARNSVNQTSNGMKDISRIVSGILISQTFYRALGSVQSMLTSVQEMYRLTEQMTISFGTMFKNFEMGASFTKELKNFAAVTPYTFADVSKNARMLSAYGFEARELIPVMTKLSDASAAMGSADGFERITRALGQIRTKGRLMQEELRQLNEAGIRTTDILMDKLGLTRDQMAKIGDLKIPADTAIKALLAGITEQYSGASALMAKTTSGLISTIKDNLSIIGEEVGSGFFGSFKDVLTRFAVGAQKASLEMQKVGFGGWLDNNFSAESVGIIRNLAANVSLLFTRFRELGAALAPVTKEFLRWIAIAMNLVLPIINAINYVVIALINAFLGLDPVIQRLLGLFLAFAVLMKVAVMFYTLNLAMQKMWMASRVLVPALYLVAGGIKALAIACTQSVWVLMLTAAAAALIYFALKSDWAAGVVNNLSGALNGLFNNDPSSYFAPSQDTTKDWGDYAGNVGDATGNMEDLGDATKDANKAAKEALASFDEVFQLGGPDSKEVTPVWGDIALPDIAALDVPITADLALEDVKMPSIGALGELFTDNIRNALIGAGIGGLIGFLLFGTPGAMIGASIGAYIGYMWDEFSSSLKATFTGAGIGAIIGAVAKMIVGFFKLAFGIQSPSTVMRDEVGIFLTQGLWEGIVGAISWIGEKIFGFVGNIITFFKEAFGIQSPSTVMSDNVGTYVTQGLWEGIVGGLAWIGEKINGFVDNVVYFFKDAFGIQSPSTVMSGTVGTYVTQGLWEGIVGGLAWIGEKISGFVDNVIYFFKDAFGIQSPSTVMSGSVGTYVTQGLWEGIVGGLSWLGSNIAGFVSNTVSFFAALPGNVVSVGSDTISNIWSGISGSADWLYNGVASVASNIGSYFQNISGNMGSVGVNIVTGIWSGITNAVGWLGDKIAGFGDTVVQAFCDVFEIKSPSRVMRDEVGSYIGQGVIIGMEQSLSGLNGIVKDTVNAATTGLDFKTTVANAVDTTQDTKNQTIINTAGSMLNDMLTTVTSGFFDSLYDGFIWLSNKVGELFSLDMSSSASIPASYNAALTRATNAPNVTNLPSSSAINANNSPQQAQGTSPQAGYDVEAIVKSAVDSAMAYMPTPIYAGNIIADQRSLKELNIVLKKIDANSQRRNV